MSKLFTILTLVCVLSTSAIAQIKLKSGAYISENKIFVRLYQDNIDVLRDNEYIKKSTPPFLLKSLSIKEADLSASKYSLDEIKKIEKAEEPLFRTYVFPVPTGKNPITYCNYLKSKYSNLVEIAEPYYIAQKMGSTPNDPSINKQNMLINIKALEAWLLYDGDDTITIGISDNGVDQNHPDLKGNIAYNTAEIPDNGIDDDNNGYIDDYAGCNLANQEDGLGWGNTYHKDQHGTEVAGIASATYNNNVGIAGIGAKTKFFPIKTSPSPSNDIIYTYESIRYAALREFDILNCSWGIVKQFSEIDQSIIDYAVSRGVVIIASGGNATVPEVLDRNSSVFFPAGYDGVLGVGEVDNGDKNTSESMFGRHIRVVAPGEGNYSTSGEGYDYVEGGSSFAAPVITGAAALAKGKHPSLTANQIIEFVRQCTDDISAKNSGSAKLIPGRINLEKVVTLDPMSLAGIRYEGKQYYDSKGQEVGRIFMDSSYKMKVRTRNYLAALTNARFVLSTAYDPHNAIKVINSEVTLDQVNASSYIGLNGFEFTVKNIAFSPVVMRIDVYADGDYHDFFKFDLIPTQNYITFNHQDLSVSFGDRGEFGLVGSDNTYGVGLTFKDQYRQMGYPGSGIFFTAGNSKASGSFLGSYKTEQMWSDLDNTNLLSDEFANSNLVGIELKQEVKFYDDLSNLVRIDVTVYNKSGDNIANPACGYYLDFDINENFEKNIARVFFDAYPPELMGAENFAVEMMREDTPNMPMVAAAVYSKNSTAAAQAAGLPAVGSSSDFTEAELVNLLNNGINTQVTGLEDRAMVVGMRFNTTLADQDSVKFTVLLAMSETESSLAATIKAGVDKITSIKEKEDVVLKFYPNPVQDYLNIETAGVIQSIELCDLDGNIISSVNSINAQNYKVKTDNMASGSYFIKIKGLDFQTTKKFVIAR